MNYKRWIIVGLVAGLAMFTFWHLSTAGSDYQVLTTSDSGWHYGIARQINQQDGIINTYELSHPPEGKSPSESYMGQPLLLVSIYRGLNSINPDLTLMDVHKYFSPLIFTFAMIGAFLAARELGGNIAGFAAALLFSTMVGPIYWTKIGAIDTPPSILLFSTWTFYGVTRVLKSKGTEILKNAALAGLIYGLFLMTWPGAKYIFPIIAATLFLILVERAVEGLGFSITGIGLLVIGTSFNHFDITQLLGLFILLAGLVRIGRNWEAMETIENSIISTLKEKASLRIIGGIVAVIGISTILGVTLAGKNPSVWVGLVEGRISGFIGLGGGGGGGVSYPNIATEMRPASSQLSGFFKGMVRQLYGNSALTSLTVGFVIVAVGKVLMSAKDHELLALSWLLIVAPMPLGGSRFFRLYWVWWPIVAGFGFGVLVSWFRDVVFSPSFAFSDWLETFRQPLVLCLVFLLLVAPFVSNVRAERHASDTVPYPHGGSLPTTFYSSLLDSFQWIRENTPENSNVVIQWSYGHFAIGATNRASITDGANTGSCEPPDYIKYKEDGKGYIIGKNAPAPKYQINGRRIDVQKMMLTGDENYFAWIAKTYKENFNVPMNYIVFNNSLSGRATMRQSALLSMTNDIVETTRNVKMGGYMGLFQFERENIIFDLRKGNAKTQDNEQLAGYVIYNLKKERILSYNFNQSPEENKLLWAFTSGEQQFKFAMGGLAKFDGVPMIFRALQGTYKMPNYLEEVYRAPDGQAAVYKINYEKISDYL